MLDIRFFADKALARVALIEDAVLQRKTDRMVAQLRYLLDVTQEHANELLLPEFATRPDKERLLAFSRNIAAEHYITLLYRHTAEIFKNQNV